MISYVIITLVINRGVAQLGARLTGGQEAAGSSPVTPTIQSVLIVTERFSVRTLCFYIHILTIVLCASKKD